MEWEATPSHSSLGTPAQITHQHQNPMRFVSTRDAGHHATLSRAIERGLAPDGGLYVPEHFPELYLSDFRHAQSLPEVARVLLAPFFAGDALEGELPAICDEAFHFPAPLLPVAEGTHVLELFHGPTAAFKDFGAQFLAAVMQRIPGDDARPLTVLVATSGDTGGAVAAAFHGRPGVRVVVLYPKGRVSARQEKQLTVWGDNVQALAVHGDFDDCQRLVKEAFADEELAAARRLTSANSINLGRLLPQMVYYAAATLHYVRETGVLPGFVIPSGNLGNATACLWARAVGLPVREVLLATNANPTLTDFLATGRWEPRPAVPTLASAMDVGDPSNVERLVDLYGGWTQLRRRARGIAVSDEQIRTQIRSAPQRWGMVWDPHTATAAAARAQLSSSDWVLVATAHPAKFEMVVEALIGRELEVPPALQRLLDRPGAATEIEPDLAALRRTLLASDG